MTDEGKIIGLDVAVVIRGQAGGAQGGVQSITSFGVIDTGADKVLIPRSFAKRLGLQPLDNITAFLASGEGRPAVNYAGILEIPEIGYSGLLEMTAMTEGREPNHVLLGRNFLREFLVTIDCANNTCWFHRPGLGTAPMVDDE